MSMTRALYSARLRLERLEGREVPAVTPWTLESFDQMAAGTLPVGWEAHPTGPPAVVGVSPTHSHGDGAGLRADGNSVSEARAWSPAVLPADSQVSADVYLDSLVPAQIIARGRGLDTSAPSYYAAAVTRGTQVQL